MLIEGKAICFGDNIDTDQIIAGSYLSLPTIKDMIPHAFENYPNFRNNFQALFFSTDRKDFPELISKVMIFDPDKGGNWFVDFKAGNVKYIVFKDKILKYQIGNQTEKDYVCNECRKMGIPDEEMKWPE